MRVKLCARCPYEPQDLEYHYDPEAALHVCARCDAEPGLLTNHYPRESRRRRQCTTNRDVCVTTQRSVARSVADALVLSATTPAKPPSVQKSVWTGSGAASRTTAPGYAVSRPPESYRSESHAEISRLPVGEPAPSDALFFLAPTAATSDLSRTDGPPCPLSFSEPCSEPIGTGDLHEGG